MKKFVIALLPAFCIMAFVAFYAPAPTDAQVNVACYRQQGGAKNIAGSGCEYEFQSGSTLDVQDGTTFSISDLTLTDDLTVNDDLTIAGDLAVTGTSDLKGNVSDSGGVFTFADNVIVDGAADAVQLTVQGYTTQTSLSFVVENSGGTDVATISNAGLLTADDVTSVDDVVVGDDLTVTDALAVTGTSDLKGNISDSGGVLTVVDNVMIDGQADAVQLTVQGYTTQTNAALVVENSSGTDLVTVSNTGLLTADDVTSVDDITVGDDFGVGGWETITEQTTIVVSNDSTVTPLGSNVPISSTTNAGTSSIANPTAGRLLYIHNVANTTITFTDTGTLKLGGNAALGQYDTLILKGDGTNWLQIGKVDN